MWRHTTPAIARAARIPTGASASRAKQLAWEGRLQLPVVTSAAPANSAPTPAAPANAHRQPTTKQKRQRMFAPFVITSPPPPPPPPQRSLRTLKASSSPRSAGSSSNTAVVAAPGSPLPTADPTPPIYLFADFGPTASFAAPAATATATAPAPAAASAPNAVSQPPTEEEADAAALASASMSAFARMEAQMRVRKRQAEQAAAATTAAASTDSSATSAPPAPAASSASSSSSSSNSWKVEPSLSGDLAHPPPEPQPGMCCGRDCANCVWISYSEELARWDERVAQHRRDEALRAQQQLQGATMTPTVAASSQPPRELSRFERTMARERAAARLLPPTSTPTSTPTPTST